MFMKFDTNLIVSFNDVHVQYNLVLLSPFDQFYMYVSIVFWDFAIKESRKDIKDKFQTYEKIGISKPIFILHVSLLNSFSQVTLCSCCSAVFISSFYFFVYFECCCDMFYNVNNFLNLSCLFTVIFFFVYTLVLWLKCYFHTFLVICEV